MKSLLIVLTCAFVTGAASAEKCSRDILVKYAKEKSLATSDHESINDSLSVFDWGMDSKKNEATLVGDVVRASGGHELIHVTCNESTGEKNVKTTRASGRVVGK